jgi:hypothetical protein
MSAQEFYTLIVNTRPSPCTCPGSLENLRKNLTGLFHEMHPSGLHFHQERGCQSSSTLFPPLRKTLARRLETLATMSSTSALTNKHLTSIFTKGKKQTREWPHNLFVRLQAATSAAHAARPQILERPLLRFEVAHNSSFTTFIYFRSRSHPSKIHRQVIPGEFKVFHRHHS